MVQAPQILRGNEKEILSCRKYCDMTSAKSPYWPYFFLMQFLMWAVIFQETHDALCRTGNAEYSTDQAVSDPAGTSLPGR